MTEATQILPGNNQESGLVPAWENVFEIIGKLFKQQAIRVLKISGLDEVVEDLRGRELSEMTTYSGKEIGEQFPGFTHAVLRVAGQIREMET